MTSRSKIENENVSDDRIFERMAEEFIRERLDIPATPKNIQDLKNLISNFEKSRLVNKPSLRLFDQKNNEEKSGIKEPELMITSRK